MVIVANREAANNLGINSESSISEKLSKGVLVHVNAKGRMMRMHARYKIAKYGKSIQVNFIAQAELLSCKRFSKLRSSVQERELSDMGLISSNAVSIKLHNISWPTFGCQMTFRWSSALQRTTIRLFSSQRQPRICCGIKYLKHSRS